VSFDVGAGFGEENLQNGLGCVLMQAMLRRSGGGSERLFEEGHAHSLSPADVAERGRSPGLALDHLGKKRQAHGDDLAILGKTGDGLVQENGLVF
jgi:hypothetical protein